MSTAQGGMEVHPGAAAAIASTSSNGDEPFKPVELAPDSTAATVSATALPQLVPAEIWYQQDDEGANEGQEASVPGQAGEPSSQQRRTPKIESHASRKMKKRAKKERRKLAEKAAKMGGGAEKTKTNLPAGMDGEDQDEGSQAEESETEEVPRAPAAVPSLGLDVDVDMEGEGEGVGRGDAPADGQNGALPAGAKKGKKRAACVRLEVYDDERARGPSASDERAVPTSTAEKGTENEREKEMAEPAGTMTTTAGNRSKKKRRITPATIAKQQQEKRKGH